jgi:hypothetical protein
MIQTAKDLGVQITKVRVSKSCIPTTWRSIFESFPENGLYRKIHPFWVVNNGCSRDWNVICLLLKDHPSTLSTYSMLYVRDETENSSSGGNLWENGTLRSPLAMCLFSTWCLARRRYCVGSGKASGLSFGNEGLRSRVRGKFTAS